MAKIDDILRLMHEKAASDLLMTPGTAPVLRIHGDLERMEQDAFDENSLRPILYEIISQDKIKRFEETGDLDFAYEIANLARYRINFFKHKNGLGAAIREIPSTVLTIDQLEMPPVLKDLAMLYQGLVLLSGPTGCGKSTTLAAIIDHANQNRRSHIITIEDPIEFVHQSKGCIIHHREVETHTDSFSKALRAALRENPDIILVGEMRDLETITLALEAASTGHLVLSTVHTQSAAKTIDRIIDVFPADQQAQIRTTLSETLKAVVAQTLFKRVDIKGRCAALEILICTSAVENLIREGKSHQVPSIIQTGKQLGMQTIDDAIMKLLQNHKISPEEAYAKSMQKGKFTPFLSRRSDEFI